MRGPAKFRRDRARAKEAARAHAILEPLDATTRAILTRDAMRATGRLVEQDHPTLNLHRTNHRPRRRRGIGIVGYGRRRIL